MLFIISPYHYKVSDNWQKLIFYFTYQKLKIWGLCQELDVSFLLEGSFQKYGDQVKLIVRLITPGKEAILNELKKLPTWVFSRITVIN